MDANVEFIEEENRILRTSLREMKTLLVAIARESGGEVRIDDRAIANVAATDQIEITRDQLRHDTIVKYIGE